MSRREQLRETELANPATSAKSLNNIIRNLSLRLESLERVMYLDWRFTTLGGGAVDGEFLLTPPSWPVKSISVARLREADGGSQVYTAGPSLDWVYTTGGITINFFQVLAANTAYILGLEVRG